MRHNKYDRITTSEIGRNGMYAVLCIERRFYVMHYGMQRSRVCDSGRLMTETCIEQPFLWTKRIARFIQDNIRALFLQINKIEIAPIKRKPIMMKILAEV